MRFWALAICAQHSCSCSGPHHLTCAACVQSNQLEYATKYYAAILSRATGKPLAQCQKEYLSRRR